MAAIGSPEMPRFVTVAVCAFTGYFRDTCIAVKPAQLPNDLIPFHLPLIEEVEKWREQEALEQSKAEGALAKLLDLDPSRSSR